MKVMTVFGTRPEIIRLSLIIGKLDRLFLKGATDAVAATFSKGVVIPELVFVAFQGTFAAITCCLILGAFAERAKFWPQVIAAAVVVGLIYPFSEGIVWNGNYGIQAWLEGAL